jgi:quercetin dioxygenase-like cupin family protein
VRRIVTGLDSAGRSCAVKDGEFTFVAGMAGIGLNTVFKTSQTPPPARPEGNADLLDLGVAPGLARWMVVEYEPGLAFPMHHTDTIDFDIVLSGSIELTLDDGVHELGPGDCVMMTGVDHAWKAGPDGCRLSVVVLGTPPPG